MDTWKTGRPFYSDDKLIRKMTRAINEGVGVPIGDGLVSPDGLASPPQEPEELQEEPMQGEETPAQAKAAVEKAADDLIMLATTLQDTISQHKRALDDAELQLQTIVEQLNTKLGWEIRKRQPKLMIAHKGGNVNAGYFSQNITARPDLATKQWHIDGPLAKKFKKDFPDSIGLENNPSNLADAIVAFFKDRFRTLQPGQ